MAVITISRQYGSHGDEIVARVGNLLGYDYCDKRLMAQVAAEMGLSAYEFVDFSEDNYKLQGFLDRLIAWRKPRTVAQVRSWKEDTAGSRIREIEALDEENSISFVKAIIQAVYQLGNVVIVGRGGQAILKDKPDVLHVRIQAPLDVRVSRLLDRQNYSPGGAKDAAIKHDRASTEYLRRFYDIDWVDPTLYDLVINTSKLNIEAAANLVTNAVHALLPEKV